MSRVLQSLLSLVSSALPWGGDPQNSVNSELGADLLWVDPRWEGESLLKLFRHKGLPCGGLTLLLGWYDQHIALCFDMQILGSWQFRMRYESYFRRSIEVVLYTTNIPQESIPPHWTRLWTYPSHSWAWPGVTSHLMMTLEMLWHSGSGGWGSFRATALRPGALSVWRDLLRIQTFLTTSFRSKKYNNIPINIY